MKILRNTWATVKTLFLTGYFVIRFGAKLVYKTADLALGAVTLCSNACWMIAAFCDGKRKERQLPSLCNDKGPIITMDSDLTAETKHYRETINNLFGKKETP